MPHVRICAGGGPKGPSLPRPHQLGGESVPSGRAATFGRVRDGDRRLLVYGAVAGLTGTGSASAYELLGFTERGADVEITHNWKEIMTDIMGEMTPQEMQHMGKVATITVPLIAIDRAVMAKVMGRGNASSVGQIATPGRNVGANADSFALGIAAAADAPFAFAHCVLRPVRFPMSVVAKPYTMTFFAWPYVPFTAVTGYNASLYSRTMS